MTRELLQQALDALEAALSDDQPYIERGKAAITALRSALAAPQPEPVAYVPRCHTDGNYCIVGEYKWDEIEEKPFGLADPAHWECAALYAAPPAAPAPAVPSDDAAEILAGLFNCMPKEALNNDVPDKLAKRIGAFMFAAGYRMVFDRWYLQEPPAAPAVPLTDTRKLCTCDGAGRGPGRACVVQAGGRLGELWKCAKSAAPAVREPQDERIRWRDAVIKDAESALRTAEQEFADMPTWANVGHAAKKVTHALAVIAALGIGGGGNG